MATRTERCLRCGVILGVPYQAQRVRCPNCQSIIQFQFNPNGYFSPEAPNNTYNMSIGYSPYSNYQRPPGNFRPPQISPQLLPPPVYGPKRAVLCGINYMDHAKSLKGSINDVQSMRYLLVERLGFPNASVRVYTEEERDPSRIPTKRNIREAFKWLVQGCREGDSLVFYYSGHGSRVRDSDGDEIDGHDEALCPVDFETEGKILDDEIHNAIVRPLTRGVTLHAIIDTCHSGTCLDLPYMCKVNRNGNYTWEDHRIPYAAYRGTSGGLAISISACDDHENSQDTTYFTGTSNGALTYNFIKILQYEQRLTYGRLLMALRKAIFEAQNGAGHYGAVPPQEPQMSSSATFDIYMKPFLL